MDVHCYKLCASAELCQGWAALKNFCKIVSPLQHFHPALAFVWNWVQCWTHVLFSADLLGAVEWRLRVNLVFSSPWWVFGENLVFLLWIRPLSFPRFAFTGRQVRHIAAPTFPKPGRFWWNRTSNVGSGGGCTDKSLKMATCGIHWDRLYLATVARGTLLTTIKGTKARSQAGGKGQRRS